MARKKLGVSTALVADIDSSVVEMSTRVGELDYRMLDVRLIDRDPDQPRDLAFIDLKRLPALPQLDSADPQYASKARALEGLSELAASVDEKGVLEAIEVYPNGNRFTLVFGERRWLATQIAGRAQIPARVLPRRPVDVEERQGIENLQRQDLTLAEQVVSVAAVTKAFETRTGTAMAQQDFCKATGLSKSHTSTLFAVSRAPEDVRAAVEAGRLTDLVKAGIVARLPTVEERSAAIEAVEAGASREALRQQRKPTKGRTAGRPSARVSLGYTQNLAAVRRLFVEVLGERRTSKDFADCDWNDTRSVGQAWQKFWTKFEATDGQ